MSLNNCLEYYPTNLVLHICIEARATRGKTVVYAPVICIPGSPGVGDSGDIAGLKCLSLTSDVSRQCRGFAWVMISRQYTVTYVH